MQAHGQIGVRAQYYMIPDLPPSVTDSDRIDFYSTLVGNLTDQSSIHINWHTHRQNPSTCWICDMSILMSKILLLTKSSLDMETESSSEYDSDTEIEDESLNRDEEGIPEYETEEDEPKQVDES